MGKATVDGTAVSEYNSPIAVGFGRSVMPKQVFAAAAILFLIGGTPGLYAAEIDILKKLTLAALIIRVRNLSKRRQRS